MNQFGTVNGKADVSVIIPVYNSGKDAFRAVESIARQTFLPKEVILIDDFSSEKEETQEWLQKIKKHFSDYFHVIILFQKSNLGPGEARNTGWNIATGKYIAFLDSDDVWHPQKIEIQYKFMEKHPNIGFSCHHLSIIKVENIPSFFKSSLDIKNNDFVTINPIRYLFKHYPIGGTSFVMAKNVDDIRFLKGKRYSEDYLVWLEFCFKYGGVLISKYMGAAFKPFYGERGLSKNLWKLEVGELENYKILKEIGVINFPIMFLAISFSLVKFIRRTLIVILRKKCLHE